jgi:hypothetical protein
MGETNKGGFLKEKLCQLLFSSEETKAQRQEKKKKQPGMRSQSKKLAESCLTSTLDWLRSYCFQPRYCHGDRPFPVENNENCSSEDLGQCGQNGHCSARAIPWLIVTHTLPEKDAGAGFHLTLSVQARGPVLT